MPLCYLRRPLFLLLVGYTLVLAVLHERGFLAVKPSEETLPLRLAPSVAVLGRIESPVTENFRGQKATLRVSRIAGISAEEKAVVYLPRSEGARSANEALRFGESLALEGRLRLPRPARNPGEFDERAFLEDRGIAWVIEASTYSAVGRPPWYFRPLAWAEGARRSMEECLRRRLPAEEAGLAAALALGYKPRLSRGLAAAVQDAGVMHLLVPSGAKVALVLLLIWELSTRAGFRPASRLAAAALAGGFYTLMVGAEPPYARAYLCAMILGAGELMEREAGPFQAVALSALILLVWQPRNLYSIGFQMTYLAAFGLALALPALNAAISGFRPWIKRLLQGAAVSVIVQAMLWPIFACIFGRGSLIGPVSNLILVPYSALVMAAAFAAWGADAAFGGVPAGILARILEFLVAAFRWACFKLASVPSAAVSLSPMSGRAILIYYLVVLAVLFWPRMRVSLLMLGAASLVVAAPYFQRSRLCVVFFHAARGRAALISFPGGQRWLVDAGLPGGALFKALSALGVGHLDKVVLTGCQSGRWRGLSSLSGRLPIGEIDVVSSLRRKPIFRKTELAAARLGIGFVSIPDHPAFIQCYGAVCFDFGADDGPHVRRGGGEYSIIASRLRLAAVEVQTDGATTEISNAKR